MKKTIFYPLALTPLLLASNFVSAGQVLSVTPMPNQTVFDTDKYERPQSKHPAYAANYYGLNYAYLSYETAGISSVNPSQVQLQLGHHLTRQTSLEARVALISSEEQVHYGSQTAKQSVQSFLGAYVRHGLFNLSGFEIYGLVGMTQTESKAAVIVDNYMSTITRSSMDISYGLGTHFLLGNSQNVTGNIEYNRLVTQKDFTLSSFNIGFNIYF